MEPLVREIEPWKILGISENVPLSHTCRLDSNGEAQGRITGLKRPCSLQGLRVSWIEVEAIGLESIGGWFSRCNFRGLRFLLQDAS